jgi:HlyD family secretion protein
MARSWPPILTALRALLVWTAALLVVGCSGEVIHLVGTVERTSLELAAPISEVIVEVPHRIGDRVERGAVVVRLDSEVAQAELRAFEAAHAAAQATLTGGEREFARIEGLRKANVATPQQLDVARRERDEARALVAEKEAHIAQAKKRLEDLTVRSHAPGVVDQLPYEPGERVPSGGVVAVVVADEKPWVRVWAPARVVSRLSPQATAEVRVEGLETRFSGQVGEVSREPAFTPHYALTERESAHLVYETRIVLQDAPPDLRPGLPARVELRLPEGEGRGAD